MDHHKLPLLYDALCGIPHNISGNHIAVRCYHCGDSANENEKHLYIKANPDKNEPVFYHCFRASCQASGILKTSDLQFLGITDMDVMSELSAYNRSIGKNEDKLFVPRQKRSYEFVNLNTKLNHKKLEYLNKRLGVSLLPEQLREYKIALSLYDMLDINNINWLTTNRNMCDLLNQYTIGFVSIYEDYLIERDISDKLYTGKRYTNYRLSKNESPDDKKIYSIPRTIDLMNPKSTIINIAEGPFSILGAYLNTDIGDEKPNSIWLANCGSEYLNTILFICRQYGLLKVHINIWSDSEIKLEKYQKLLKQLSNRLDIRRFTVYYNRASDDFGHSKDQIKPEAITLKQKEYYWVSSLRPNNIYF